MPEVASVLDELPTLAGAMRTAITVDEAGVGFMLPTLAGAMRTLSRRPIPRRAICCQPSQGR